MAPADMYFLFNSAPGAIKGDLLAKPNYQFEKRQRDLAKKAQQEEKRRNKAAAKAASESGGATPADGGPTEQPEAGTAPKA